MLLLPSQDPKQDFFATFPMYKIIFAQEHKQKIPSSHMWGLFLYAHPDSVLFNEDPTTRKMLVHKDFLNEDPKFSFEKYEDTLLKISNFALTKAERALMRWEQALHERDDFFASIAYSKETYELKDKMLSTTPKLWEQYESIQEKLSKERSAQTLGDIEESFLEKIQTSAA